MTDPRLDRLSALLEGLAPEVTLTMASAQSVEGQPSTEEATFLGLYLVTQGAVQLQSLGETWQIQSPALIALRSDQSYVINRSQSTAPCRLICAQTRLAGPVAALFLEEFAQQRIVALSEDDPALRLAVTLIESELDAPRCGQPALLNRAGDILFIGLLRYLVAHPRAHGSGLFNGLADPRIAKALVAIHQRPAFDWDLERLAQEAGMSRTAFAATFRAVMKRTPGKYLAAIRLATAQRAVDLGKGLKEAARKAGYANTSALSRALSKARVRTPCII